VFDGAEISLFFTFLSPHLSSFVRMHLVRGMARPMVSDSGGMGGLSDAKVRAARATGHAYKLTDGAQLYLHVSATGGRIWRMNYAFGRNGQGKPAQKTLTIGAYPAISLTWGFPLVLTGKSGQKLKPKAVTTRARTSCAVGSGGTVLPSGVA